MTKSMGEPLNVVGKKASPCSAGTPVRMMLEGVLALTL
jgi:hypothetical protein